MKKYIIFYRETIVVKDKAMVFFDHDQVEVEDVDEVIYQKYNGYKQIEYVFEVAEWPKEV